MLKSKVILQIKVNFEFVNLPDAEYWMYVPNDGSARRGQWYELKPRSGYSENVFVLIPYQNPQVKTPEARYFDVTGITAVNVPTRVNKNAITLKTRENKKTYIQKVKQLKAEIQFGNIYEINYCMEMFANDVSIEPIEVFCSLQEIAKAPYASLVRLKDEFIICASPELFLKKTGKRIESKPIKGTARRGKTIEEDDLLKSTLFKSVKERTENVMAVDVARNDLSHFAKRGSVHVNKLYTIESFETVHQMVSTVSCELKEGVSFEDIIRDSFPMASMTGAPKLKAMQLIDEYESFERNFYSGAMGLIDKNGDFQLSVIIRSIFYNQKTKHLSIAMGGAITYLSEPEKEYEECLLKAGALIKALNATL